MIQELFGVNANGLLNQNQNLPISSTIDPPHSHSPSPSPSSSTTTTTTTTVPTTTTSDNQKLRCPRCDSSHTKFCYYNNYNLTQPRHFCKTCRRYWTKGGALRNVPIGGGCRKNKGTTVTTTIGKLKAATMSSDQLAKSSFMHGFELDHHSNLNSNPIIWSGPPQPSHLLSLFRASQNPNPSFTSNIPITTHMKDHNSMGGSNMGSLGFEPLWRNNHQGHQNQHQDHEGVQTVPLILGSNVANMTSSSSTILDSAPVLASGGDLGFWNQTLPWSDLAATNGAYP